jgi:Tn3 transposase DDE domain
MASNRREDHEISMLSLHLIQNCMVYINTLMIQKLMAQPHWQGKFTPRLRGADPADLGACEPLWPVRSQYELAAGSFVIEVAAGDTTVGSTPHSGRRK